MTKQFNTSLDPNNLTEEQLRKILMVRILVGDTEGSIFYPMMDDVNYILILDLCGWDVLRAARRIGVSIALQLTRVNYRERTGDIEVWNNASLEYSKALQNFLNDNSAANLPDKINAYAVGISKKETYKYLNDPDAMISPLAQISPCVAWWTRCDNYPPCEGYRGLDNFVG